MKTFKGQKIKPLNLIYLSIQFRLLNTSSMIVQYTCALFLIIKKGHCVNKGIIIAIFIVTILHETTTNKVMFISPQQP